MTEPVSDQPAEPSPVVTASQDAAPTPPLIQPITEPEPQATSPSREFPSEATQRNRRWMFYALIALGALALVAFLFVGYGAFSQRMEAARKLDKATAIVQAADKDVVEIDAAVSAQITPALAAEAAAAAAKTPKVDEQLVAAVALIDEAYPKLNDDERERALLLKASAEARRKMLAEAPPVLAVNEQAAKALPLAEQAWQAALDADTSSDQAVASYNKLTKAGVTKSQSLNKEAAAKLALAQAKFQEAESAFSAAPFETYLAYLATRLSINKLSQQSDAAWLAGDVAKANSLIATYNAEDRTAVEQAKSLPASPEAAVADAFKSSAGAATDAYYKARDEALAADKRLRTY